MEMKSDLQWSRSKDWCPEQSLQNSQNIIDGEGMLGRPFAFAPQFIS